MSMPPLKFTGSREEVLEELEERTTARILWGQDRKAAELEAAAEKIRNGARRATAVQTEYTVE